MNQLMAPVFSQSIIKMLSVPINTVKEYTLPLKTVTDDMKVIHSTPLPSYSIFEFPTYKFNPMIASHLGVGQI